MTTTIPAGWLPIESAPKDGQSILGRGPRQDTVVIAWHEWAQPEARWKAVHLDVNGYECPEIVLRGEPTHWMPLPAAPGVSTVEQDERSATHGMTLGERIAHVGGRTNAQGYVEFGSPMAVDALIQHVLRDIDCTRQEDDGAYQARYRLPGGQWSSWGHVVCGVKGHEQELRYLPGERRPAPAAGDARGTTERHTIEGTISFMRSDAESQVCVCCPPKTGHIFSRGVDWDAWETGAPEHFGRGPDVLVRRYATGINANEGKRVRVTVEVLPDDLAAQRKGDA